MTEARRTITGRSEMIYESVQQFPGGLEKISAAAAAFSDGRGVTIYTSWGTAKLSWEHLDAIHKAAQEAFSRMPAPEEINTVEMHDD